MTLIIKSPNLYSLILLTRIFFLPPSPNLSFDNSFIPFTVQNFKIRSTRRSHRAWKISQGRFAGERCVERPFYFSSAGWGDERALVSGGKERSSTLLLRGLDAPETRLSRYYKSSSRLDRATSRKRRLLFLRRKIATWFEDNLREAVGLPPLKSYFSRILVSE